ncbi:Transcription factor bHLH110 [Apostasia shenzhenica]|uniref:Transcription factor bHLH110 n=1 Tax=Apostasia shenzhenica TaxID=1088818 RepID=A0A2I0AL19_9ASPA|nr:Transcription factor bHLH110 [Apostasia shenzhenica]
MTPSVSLPKGSRQQEAEPAAQSPLKCCLSRLISSLLCRFHLVLRFGFFEQEKKDKIGERVAALQQLVSPFGKLAQSDTASVLTEATAYIKFLHDQLQVLSAPYFHASTGRPQLNNDFDAGRRVLQPEEQGAVSDASGFNGPDCAEQWCRYLGSYIQVASL